MFAKLKNEAVLTFKLRNEGPVLINSGTSAKIQPRPDMSFVRTLHNGVETVYLPGSSIKGVFRSRYEQVMRMLKQNVCDTFEPKDQEKRKTCNQTIKAKRKSDELLSGTEIYNKHCCEACKLFGNLSLAGRLSFADAYPIDQWNVGMRHGVGIDRITGAAFPGALYEIEALEAGTFLVTCKLTNFKLYQLRTVLWVLEDVDDGLVTFGMGGSRGMGQMRIVDNHAELTYRKYADDAPQLDGVRADTLFGSQVKISGLSDILAALAINTQDELINAIKGGR